MFGEVAGSVFQGCSKHACRLHARALSVKCVSSLCVRVLMVGKCIITTREWSLKGDTVEYSMHERPGRGMNFGRHIAVPVKSLLDLVDCLRWSGIELRRPLPPLHKENKLYASGEHIRNQLGTRRRTWSPMYRHTLSRLRVRLHLHPCNTYLYIVCCHIFSTRFWKQMSWRT